MINFPDSPSLNDQFTVSGKKWTWDGTSWVLSSTLVYDVPNGVPSLDSSGKILPSVIPSTVEKLGELAGINTQTGTSYTLVIGDKGKMVEMNNASANTLTVPPNSSVAFPINTRIDLVQLGAGQTTIAAGAGVTIRSSGSKLKLTGQYSGASLYKRGTDEWVLVGDITT